jgi:hypothetical protein
MGRPKRRSNNSNVEKVVIDAARLETLRSLLGSLPTPRQKAVFLWMWLCAHDRRTPSSEVAARELGLAVAEVEEDFLAIRSAAENAGLSGLL